MQTRLVSYQVKIMTRKSRARVKKYTLDKEFMNDKAKDT
jgi:hypothetical protein